MPNTHTPILIIGAGPTGLALANYLARAGVAFKIIDKNTARSDKSKALGMQAGTLESIEESLGTAVAEAFVNTGKPVQHIQINPYHRAVVHVDISTIPSRYNYVLLIPQSETERLLEQNLNQQGIFVERECELISLQEESDSVLATLKTQSGNEVITADFAVGCDGASSTVRHQLNIPFAGGEYTGDFILGDVEFKKPQPVALQIFLSEHGALACFPLLEEKRARLILIPKKQENADTRDISFEEFKEIASNLSPLSNSLEKGIWLTRFSIHHRIASHFRKGRVFLAGDAAHIHSPAGGQGMNTGIQDAFNLGFKFVKVLSGKEDLKLLDLYEQERYPVAQRILRGTDIASRVLFANTPLPRFLKEFVLPWIAKKKWFQRRMALAISELKTARKEIELRKS